MELTLELLYTKILKKVGVSGTYPSKDNCYIVDVYQRETNEFLYTINYCPKPVFEAWEVMKELKAKFGIGKTDMLPLIRVFGDYGDWQYEAGAIDVQMDNEDI